MCKFVVIIASNSRVSLLLLLGDVQWADNASIAVVRSLAMQKLKKFFLVCCYRDDEVTDEHPFCKMLRDVSTITTHVKLNNCEEHVLNEALSGLFCLSPRLIRPLGKIIHARTRGNLLFIRQLLLLLHREGMLKIEFASKRWIWNELMIIDTNLPTIVAMCFANSIHDLPVEVQIALQTMATFGASVKSQYLLMLEHEFILNIVNSLKLAEAEGLVTKVNDTLHFFMT